MHYIACALTHASVAATDTLRVAILAEATFVDVLVGGALRHTAVVIHADLASSAYLGALQVCGSDDTYIIQPIGDAIS